MFYLLNWRLWLLAGFLALIPISYVKGRHDGRQIQRAENASAVAEANIEARKMEQRRQDRVDEAARLASARQRSRIAADAGVVSELDGLRNAADAAERVAKESKAAAAKHAVTCTALLKEGAGLLAEVQRAADGHADDVRTLLDGWPK